VIRTYRVLSSTRLGYRGAFLLFLAIIDVIYGWFLINPTPEQSRTTQFIWRDHIMPTQAWGVIWICVAIILVVSAFMRQDRIGYAAAIALKVGWAFIAAVAGLTGSVQGAWTTVAIWGGFAALTILESGRPEPLHTHDVTIMSKDEA
jgi:peptidoglycan/LPS O-acetylase OafA/YrhL